jgi:hypothetical protein
VHNAKGGFGCPFLVKYGHGELAEWLMAPVLKTGIPEKVSGVRIPRSPPDQSKSIRWGVWLETHVWLATWLALPVAIVVGFIQSARTKFKEVDWFRSLAEYRSRLDPDPNHVFPVVDQRIFNADQSNPRVAVMHCFVPDHFQQQPASDEGQGITGLTGDWRTRVFASEIAVACATRCVRNLRSDLNAAFEGRQSRQQYIQHEINPAFLDNRWRQLLPP